MKGQAGILVRRLRERVRHSAASGCRWIVHPRMHWRASRQWHAQGIPHPTYGVRYLATALLGMLALFTGWMAPVTAQTPPPPGSVHREVEDDPPADEDADPATRSGSRAVPVSRAMPVVRGRFRSIQVNVDSQGNNILNDAANEPSIAIDPTNPERIVIGWRQFNNVISNFRQAGWGYSHNGGATWTFPGVIQPGVFRSDPVLGEDSDGTIYYYSLTTVRGGFTCDMYRSFDGGVSWDSGTYARGGDKQWMTIDKSGGPGDGHIYAYWTQFYSCCAGGQFTRSTDAGATYAQPIPLPFSPYWGTLTVGPDGELYVVGAELGVLKSTNAQNAGSTPTFTTSVASLDGYPNSFSGGPNPDGLLGQVWIATDHSTGPRRGWVYVLASVTPFGGGDPLDVMFTRSRDGGQSWDPPVRVNDDAPGNGAWQWFGTMDVAPNGRIDVIWNDTRASLGDFRYSELYYSSSEDGGATWSANEPMSPPFNSWIGWPNQNKIGDYYDMISDDDGASLAYSATFTGGQDVYFLRIDRDCNGNGINDEVDIATGTSPDCNSNGVPDECEISEGITPDCNANGIPDACDIAHGTAVDCNTNGKPDACDIADAASLDCNLNQVPDECDVAGGIVVDCNANHIPDECDVSSGTSGDDSPLVGGDGIPDECQGDCNGNGVPDDQDIASTYGDDCDGNGIPDECQTMLKISDPRPVDLAAASDDAVDAYPQLATDGRGHWVLGWTHREEHAEPIAGIDYDVRIARSDDDGTGWSVPITLNPNAATDTLSDVVTAIATDRAGTWLALWESETALFEADIMVSRSADNGASWSSPMPVNSDAAVDARDDTIARLATDRAGVWIAAWFSGPGGGERAFYARSLDNGATWSTLTELSGPQARDVDISYASGTWILAWQVHDITGNAWNVVASRSTDSGLSWSAPTVLSKGLDPRIASDGKGTWLIAFYWFSAGLSSSNRESDVFYSRSTDDGRLWPAPALLNVNGDVDSGDDESCMIATDTHGNWFAVWASSEALVETDGSDWDILFARSSDGGLTWTTPQLFNNTATHIGGNHLPALVSDEGVRWSATWHSTDTLQSTIGDDLDILLAGFYIFAPLDCNCNGIRDEVELVTGVDNDCNANNLPDECDIAEGTSPDCDGNGVPDECEPDVDGDGVIDGCDNCPGLSNADQLDVDGDDVGDACDPCPLDNPDDLDGDGACSSDEQCPLDPNKQEPGQCGCGFAETDSDGDGVANCVDQCPDIDDTLFAPGCAGEIPTVSAWGLVVLALLLLTGAKVGFARRVSVG